MKTTTIGIILVIVGVLSAACLLSLSNQLVPQPQESEQIILDSTFSEPRKNIDGDPDDYGFYAEGDPDDLG